MRKKVIASIITLILFVAWKLLDFYEYVAIFYTPDELSKRNEPWITFVKPLLLSRSGARMSIVVLILILLTIWLCEPINKIFDKPKSSFRVSIIGYHVYGDVLLWMLQEEKTGSDRYRKLHGAMQISFTNLSDAMIMFSGFTVVAKMKEGGRTELQFLRASSSALNLYYGKSLKCVKKIEYVTFNESISKGSIAPGQTVIGWIVLMSPASDDYTFEFREFAGQTHSGKIISKLPPHEGGSEIFFPVQSSQIGISEETFDLASGAYPTACSELNGLGEILNKIPNDCPPTSGGWHSSYDSANAILRGEVVGKFSTLDFIVDKAAVAERGRYAGESYVLAWLPTSRTAGWPVLLYAYFDGADAPTVQKVLRHVRNDLIEISGKITRADFAVFEHDGIRLNIDVRSCRIVT